MGKKGLPKGQTNNPKGRPPGIVDRRHFFYDAMQTLQRIGHNPIESLAMIAQDQTIDIVHRIKADCALIDKVSPSLKSIEHRLDPDQHNDLLKLREEMLALEKLYKKDY